MPWVMSTTVTPSRGPLVIGSLGPEVALGRHTVIRAPALLEHPFGVPGPARGPGLRITGVLEYWNGRLFPKGSVPAPGYLSQIDDVAVGLHLGEVGDCLVVVEEAHGDLLLVELDGPPAGWVGLEDRPGGWSSSSSRCFTRPGLVAKRESSRSSVALMALQRPRHWVSVMTPTASHRLSWQRKAR